MGRGGMGEVWRAFDVALQRPVAVKVLLGNWLSDPHKHHAMARFRREGRAVARLSHPAIATVFDAGEHDGQPFLVMELLEGEDLETVLAREHAGLPIEQTGSRPGSGHHNRQTRKQPLAVPDRCR
jgi:serine/threonine protein kinase